MSAGKSARLSIREIAELSLFCALMVAGKECLRLIPNVHPVTLLLAGNDMRGHKAPPVAVFLQYNTDLDEFQAV